jgi:hypothetical protein
MAIEKDNKGSLLEKIAFALLPVLVACIGYLLSSLLKLEQQVTVLNQKMSLVVSMDNQQLPNVASELAREKVRQEAIAAFDEDRKEIAIIEEKLKHMKGSKE